MPGRHGYATLVLGDRAGLALQPCCMAFRLARSTQSTNAARKRARSPRPS
ncbi:hypothetical protein DB30_06727 [Enhygromyxa salina]|uniref:Uncharacterized protein n=1 Tax=Enhygromyxa salina TaxID=215803 RepID=A0A0C2CXX4_9BACT|nr:hypothetical protein DB30_06727 [Enhygromyxa salina]